MIVKYQEVMEFINASDSYTLQLIHKAIEDSFQSETRRRFESTTYCNQRYSGNGYQYLLLDNYPITGIERVSFGHEAAIKIRNTSTDAMNSYAEVVYTDYAPVSLKLVVQGGANNSSTTAAFATYTTMATLIAQVTGSNGWEATIYDTDFNALKSTNLLERRYQFAGSWNGVARTSDVHLYMAGEPVENESFWAEDKESGILHCGSGFPHGSGNVVITFAAGYTEALMPTEIKVAILGWIQQVYRHRQEDTFGLTRLSLGDLSVTYEDMPVFTQGIIEKYKRG